MYRILLCLTTAVWMCTGCAEVNSKKKEQEKLAESRHSDSLNKKVKALLDRYYALSESLVSWDSTGANSSAVNFAKDLDTAAFDELKNDTAVYGKTMRELIALTSNLIRIAERPDLTEKRQNFNAVTEHLYGLLHALRFDRAKIYLHECTMPYNDGGSGFWLSETADSLRNPYLGLYHPKYKKAMLDCGITRDSLNFVKYEDGKN